MVAFLLNRYNHNILLLLKRNINGFVFCSSNPTYMCSILCHVTLSPTHTQTDTDTDTDTVSKADKCTHTHTYTHTHTHTQWVKQTPAKSRSHKKMYEKVFSTEIIYNSNYTPNHSDN